MSTRKVKKLHRVKGRTIVKTYRIIPYDELVEILKKDGEAFFEDSRDQPLKRQTVWKAARTLSEMLGRKVRVDRALLKLENGLSIEGYAFAVEEK